MATFNLDKTVLVVALTRFLGEADAGSDDIGQMFDFQRLLDILTGDKAYLIGQSIKLDDYEFEVLEKYLEEI